MEFKFKQFTIKQERSAMKVNTDGVLLGAWMTLPQTQTKAPHERMETPQAQTYSPGARMHPPHAIMEDFQHSALIHLLDIGTGTGLIALMAAQRLSQTQTVGITTVIDALEIDFESHQDAVENFANSPWKNADGGILLKAQHSSLQQYAQLISSTSSICNKYDLIFSNPPYFIDSLKSPHKARSNARHTDTLSQSEIIKYSLMLLKEGGRLAIILPAEEGEQFMQKISFLLNTAREKMEYGPSQSKPVLAPVRLCKVHTTTRKPPKRYLMEFELTTAANVFPTSVKEQLIIMEENCYTAAYKMLTSPFYLNF